VSLACPRCQSPTRAVDSRESAYGWRRRRKCEGCGWRFTTYERIDLPLLCEQDLRELMSVLDKVVGRFDKRSRRNKALGRDTKVLLTKECPTQ
jgi:transcriptional regulator NrdR family protein